MRSGFLLLLVCLSLPASAGMVGVLSKTGPISEGLVESYRQQILQLQPPPARMTRRDFWQTLKHAKSVRELAQQMQNSNLPDVDKQFVQGLARDLFHNSPHAQIAAFTSDSVAEIVRILQRGIVNFERAQAVSHSSPLHDGSYDIVGYRIVQEDESISYLLSYREGKTARENSDARPRINLVLTTGANPEQMRRVVVGDHRRAEQGLEARSRAEQQVVNLLNF